MKRQATSSNTFNGPSTADASSPGPLAKAKSHGVLMQINGSNADEGTAAAPASSVMPEASSFAPPKLEARQSVMLRSQYTVSNLLAFSGGPIDVGDKEKFKHEVEVTRARIHSLSRRTIGTTMTTIDGSIAAAAAAASHMMLPLNTGRRRGVPE